MIENLLDIERAVLGACLMYEKHFFESEHHLTIETFTDPTHSAIYEGLKKWYGDGGNSDLSMIATTINSLKKVDAVVDFEYLLNYKQLVNHKNLDKHIGILKDNFQRNLFISSLEDARVDLKDESIPIEAVYSDIETKFNSLVQNNTEGYETHISSTIRETLEKIAKARQSNELTGIDTGYEDMNEFFGGLHPTDQMIIAARPGMGKTTFTANLLLNIASKGIPIIFFSLEMSRDQVNQKFLEFLSGVSTEDMRSANITDVEMERLQDSAARLYEMPIHIHDSANSIDQIITEARIAKRKHGIKVMALDYIGLVQHSNQRLNRNSQLEDISRRLKLMAGASDCNTCNLILSQLNRSVESRTDKRPLMSDLRDSGAIEQDADCIMFLYRENYYNRDSESNETEIIIAKNRHGRQSTLLRSFENRRFVQPDTPDLGW